MRILFITHRYPPRTGGVETHVQKLAKRLVNRGHDVTVFSADAGPDVSKESTDEGVLVRRFRSVSPGGAFYIAPQISLAVHRADADVVHAHNYHAFSLFFAVLGLSDEIFVVTTHYHGESESSVRDALLSLYHPFGRWAVRQADNVIAVSEWERERLELDFDIEATVIPNGIEIERFENVEPEQRNRPYCLCVGRLEEYKGIQHVIRAMNKLPEYDLLVAGKGPYRAELEQIACEAGVTESVEFLGYADEERLPGLYAGSEAYVSMSSLEAYGRTVAEALASGTQCVVCTEGALRDWADHPNVVAVENLGSERIAEAISSCERNEVAATLPTWDSVTEDVLELYQ